MQGVAHMRPVLGQTCIQRGLFYKKDLKKIFISYQTVTERYCDCVASL